MKSRILLLALTAFVAALPARAETARVRIKTETSGGNTRVVLTHSRQVVYAIRETSSSLEIMYAEPIRAEPTSRRVKTAALQRFMLQGRDTLIFDLARDYRGYQTFELHNPFRLVLDLQAASTAAQPPAVAPQHDPSRTIIVIDPGHGGIETGATGPTGLKEKDVTLDIARRLKRQLQRRRSIHVVLTRDEDRLVGLDERTAIANHNRADLFLSIHLNASPRQKAEGAETYFLASDATDDKARTLAALENRSSGVPETSVRSDGDPRSLDLVLWDLAQNQYLFESSLLAESVQSHLNALTGTRDRGVRQAPFRVLMGATMPAILVEVGFISNGEEEARFQTLGYRTRVVEAIAAAVDEFLRNAERLSRPGG